MSWPSRRERFVLALLALLAAAVILGGCGDRSSSGGARVLLVEVRNASSTTTEVEVWSDVALAPGLPSYYYSPSHGKKAIPPGTSGFWRIRPLPGRIVAIVGPTASSGWIAYAYDRAAFGAGYLYVEVR